MNPSQPAFQLAFTNDQLNVTGDNTQYVMTGAIWTEILDAGNRVSNGTFTAPVTGKYQFTLSVLGRDITASHDRFEIRLFTSNRSYSFTMVDAKSVDASGLLMLTGTILADMDVNDIAVATLLIYGSAKTAGIFATYTNFSGFLAC
jgi:hypothetical protein